jgi:hypothetical protein
LKRSREWARENPHNIAAYDRKRNLKGSYEMTIEQFDAMRQSQRGACAIICSEPFTETPHVDHDHTTGKVRALLCKHCNVGLGHFRDNTERLRAAMTYLDVHSSAYQKRINGPDN